jgi:hypothetical protein
MEMSFVSPGHFQVEFVPFSHNTVHLVLIVPDIEMQLLREN